MKSTNFIGTTNVAFKCRQWNVSKLILTSTVDSVIQYNSEFHYQTECKSERPEKEKKFLMGYYAFTKAQSEAIVICERNRRMANGNKMKTAILRPTVMYGELDPYYVPQALRVAKSTGGWLLQPFTFHTDPVLQCTYVGEYPLFLFKIQ
jgi:nucleoside-diphosphate-sugar epimerase